MTQELSAVLAVVPMASSAMDYYSAILDQNVLGKKTDSTRRESLRRLRELYGLDESTPIFKVMRMLHAIDSASLQLLAIQVAWARDPLFRATTQPVIEASSGSPVKTIALFHALKEAFPNRYSDQSLNQTARHAASSWTQSGHLSGRTKKTRQRVRQTAVAATMALFLGRIAGYHGSAVFSSPWCRLLDLDADRARTIGIEAHRAGLLNLKAIGEVVELSFPLFAELQDIPS